MYTISFLRKRFYEWKKLLYEYISDTQKKIFAATALCRTTTAMTTKTTATTPDG